MLTCAAGESSCETSTYRGVCSRAMLCVPRSCSFWCACAGAGVSVAEVSLQGDAEEAVNGETDSLPGAMAGIVGETSGLGGETLTSSASRTHARASEAERSCEHGSFPASRSLIASDSSHDSSHWGDWGDSGETLKGEGQRCCFAAVLPSAAMISSKSSRRWSAQADPSWHRLRATLRSSV